MQGATLARVGSHERAPHAEVADRSVQLAHRGVHVLHGNAGGDWIGGIAGQLGVSGNFSADPLFCDPDNGDFTLSSQSPCLPGNHPDGADCGLIGALGQGCDPVSVEPETWAGIKSRYRGGRP